MDANAAKVTQIFLGYRYARSLILAIIESLKANGVSLARQLVGEAGKLTYI